MIRSSHQRQYIPPPSRSSKSRRKISYYNDRFFHLPTVLAVNDPFLNRLYGAVSNVLDDHPYPETTEDFRRRTAEIKQNVQNLNLSADQQGFLRRLMTETGVTLVSFFYAKNYLIYFLSLKVDLWQGSHIITRDNGYLYDTWSKLPHARPRFSSHYGYVPLQQYGINFLDHQLLFGKTALDGPTWFQMEAHGFEPNALYSDPNLALYHGQDFVKYRIHGMNVGPFGFSPHTETQNPIILPFKRLETQKVRPRKVFQSDRLFRFK